MPNLENGTVLRVHAGERSSAAKVAWARGVEATHKLWPRVGRHEQLHGMGEGAVGSSC